MALVKYGGGVASMSGKQGGAVHARGRTGATIKDWTKPCNPGTPVQTQRRATFAAQTAAWGLLTVAQRDAWQAFANTTARLNRQGDVYVPTGRQLYVELNANLQLIARPAITDPPLGATPPAINPALALDVEETANVLTGLDITGGATDATVKWLVKAAPMQMTGRNNVNRQMRQLGYYTAGATVAIDVKYILLFGDVAPIGAQVQVQVNAIDIDTGLSSPVLMMIGTAAV